jgi:hypothetical protein
MIENILLTPSSDFYIANILHDPAGNALDPRTIDSLDLGTIDVQGIPIGVTIRNLLVKGMSDVQVAFDGDGNPEISVDGNTVNFHAILPNREANGELDVTISGTAMPPGTIALTIAAIRDLTGIFDATEGSGGLSTVTVTFTGLTLDIDLAAGAMVIVVKLPTVFNDTINRVLNQPDTQAKFLAQVNDKLSSPDILSGLSQVATAQARAALGTS